jgi:N-acetylmuramoyl-L-alanine amidase
VLFLLWGAFFTTVGLAAPADASVKITGVRWSRTVDAVTGMIKVRLAVETSGPVEVDPFITASPNWRIITTLRRADVDTFVIPPSPDTSVVTKMSLTKSGRDTIHIAVDLPGTVNKGQYNVVTIPADSKTKRPFQIVFDLQRIPPPGESKFLAGLKGKVVVIDPGHGGFDPGAIGVQGTREKDLNLAVAMLVKEKLAQAGAKVVMTRETDIDVPSRNGAGRGDLQARTTIANENGADVFISVHHNAAVRASANGTGTYYYPKTMFDGILAQSLQVAMLQEGGLADYGVRMANFYVVKHVTMPAALLEIGFLSNLQEEQILNSPAFQQKIAQAVVTGIDRFFVQTATQRRDER